MRFGKQQQETPQMFRKPKEPAATIDIAALQNTLRDAVNPALQKLLTHSADIEHIVKTLLMGINHLNKRFDRIEALLMHLPAIAEAEQGRIKQEEELKGKLDTKIEDLELTNRCRNALIADHAYDFQSDKKWRRWGTVRDLTLSTSGKLSTTPNLGRKSLNEIEELLASMGLSLKKG